MGRRGSTGELLERDRVLGKLDELLARAAEGEGATVLIAGEAGAGKTSVVREFSRRVGSRARVLLGGCDPLSTPRPLGPLVDISESHESGLPRLFDGDASPIELFGRVLRELTAGAVPTILILEDLHWADDGTLDLVRFIGRRVIDTNGLLLCTFRDDQLGGDHPLRSVLGHLAPLRSSHRVWIPPLSADAVVVLIGDRAIPAAEVHRVTGGNAFFVTEIIAAGDFVPPSVHDAVLARLVALDPSVRAVAETVSVAPSALELEIVVGLGDLDETDVDAAIDSGVLEHDRGRVRFRHELARTVVEASLHPGRRTALHRAMVKAITATGSTNSARLAHHAIAIGDRELVRAYGVPAAREAARRGAHRQAIALFETVLQHRTDPPTSEDAALRTDFVYSLSRADEALRARSEIADLVDGLRRGGDPKRLGAALTLQARVEWNTGRASAIAREAIEVLKGLGDSIELATAYWSLGYLLAIDRRRLPAVTAIERASAVLDSVADDGLAIWIAYARGAIEIWMGDCSLGVRLLQECHAEALRIGDMGTVVSTLNVLGAGHGERREYAVALTYLDECIAAAIDADLDADAAFCVAWQALIAYEQGRWDDAADLADRVEAAERVGTGARSTPAATALAALGRVRIRRGDPDGVELLKNVLDNGGDSHIQNLWTPCCGLAEAAWLAGRHEEAAEHVRHLYTEALERDSPWLLGEAAFWMWRAGAIDESPAAAAEPFRLQMAGDWRAAAAAWKSIGCPYEEALALADGDDAALVRAITIFDSLGARPAAGLTRAALRDRGVTRVPGRPNASTRLNPAGLTTRQFEVLRLVTGGLSNGDIASELFVSKRTVEHHVSAIFDKLGVETRAQAIAAATPMVAGRRDA